MWIHIFYESPVFGEAIPNPTLNIQRKYYIVDSGYPNIHGVSTPYKKGAITFGWLNGNKDHVSTQNIEMYYCKTTDRIIEDEICRQNDSQ